MRNARETSFPGRLLEISLATPPGEPSVLMNRDKVFERDKIAA
jgi:hypothetical protein